MVLSTLARVGVRGKKQPKPGVSVARLIGFLYTVGRAISKYVSILGLVNQLSGNGSASWEERRQKKGPESAG